MGSGIALLLWTAQLPSPFLFLYHRYVSILKYNTAGVCLAIKKAMPVNGHRLFDYKRTRCNGDNGKIGSPYHHPSPRGEGAPKGRIGHQRYEREWGRSVSSTSFMRAPYPPLCGPPSPCGEGLGGAPLRVDFCKRRCPKVAFKSLVTVPHDTFLYYSTGDE